MGWQSRKKVSEMKYLFIGAHTDDCELACGGTMAKLVEQGNKVLHIPVSICGRQDLADEAYDSSKVLGVEIWALNFTVRKIHDDAQALADYFHTFRNSWDVVFTHSIDDKHPDHRTVSEECRRIFNGNLITFISPWNGNENTNYYVEISPEHLEKKIAALSCYKSQAHRTYMNPDFIRAQAIYNGIKCGKQYAEGFTLVKGIDFVEVCSEFRKSREGTTKKVRSLNDIEKPE